MNREEYEISIEELKRVDKNTCTVIDIRDEIFITTEIFQTR